MPRDLAPGSRIHIFPNLKIREARSIIGRMGNTLSFGYGEQRRTPAIGTHASGIIQRNPDVFAAQWSSAAFRRILLHRTVPITRQVDLSNA